MFFIETEKDRRDVGKLPWLFDTRKKWEIARAEWQGKAGILAPAVPVVPYSCFFSGQNQN